MEVMGLSQWLYLHVEMTRSSCRSMYIFVYLLVFTCGRGTSTFG